ncbi:MAG: DUF362 domain-containing protein [Planctomycetes bacterium]|nr:DUF362 domain-containing protein [Planctomycetota bacterium]
MDISRRDFLKGAVGVAALLTVPGSKPTLGATADLPVGATRRVAPTLSGAADSAELLTAEALLPKSGPKSGVFCITDYSSVDKDWRLDAGRVERMVEALLVGFTRTSSVEEAWGHIIPELKPTSRIAIKVNCINPKLPSHPEVTLSLASTLIKAGVRDNNIIIWDRLEGNVIEGLSSCGYTINTSMEGIRCIAVATNGVGFDGKNLLHVPSVKKSFPVTRIISEMCDFMVNVAVLKDHGISGVTGGMKNFYGAIPLWNEFALMDVKRMHQNHGSPQIAELYNNSIIRDKVRLNVCDALLACYDGGPSGRPQWAQYQLMASTDPVALDSIGLRIIEAKRLEAGLPPATVKAGYIEAATRLGLGHMEPQKIEFKEAVLS